MNKSAVTILVIAELIAVFVVARLWIQKRMSLIPRILVSILFLIPPIFMVWYAYFEFFGRETILGSNKPEKAPDEDH